MFVVVCVCGLSVVRFVCSVVLLVSVGEYMWIVF